MNTSLPTAVLLHGGTPARRTALAAALRATFHEDIRIRLSSRAAEAAKCLADPAVRAVFLLDAPVDSEAVRQAVAARGLAPRVYDIEPRDQADVIVPLIRGLAPDAR